MTRKPDIQIAGTKASLIIVQGVTDIVVDILAGHDDVTSFVNHSLVFVAKADRERCEFDVYRFPIPVREHCNFCLPIFYFIQPLPLLIILVISRLLAFRVMSLS